MIETTCKSVGINYDYVFLKLVDVLFQLAYSLQFKNHVWTCSKTVFRKTDELKVIIPHFFTAENSYMSSAYL